jgi:hypothetical protein
VDGHRFDNLAKSLRSRRSIVGLAVGLVALAGVNRDETAAKKCKKKCGPCKRCKKGKCKPKLGSPRCGPCSFCEGGACRALCPRAECVESGGEEVCLKECDPPCDTCSECNRIQGRCEPLCDGPCEECQSGNCVPKAAGASCGDCHECQGTNCVALCDANEGCFEGACEDLSGSCTGTSDGCVSGLGEACSFAGAAGHCVKLDNGAPFCYSKLQCGLENVPICQVNDDCQNAGFGEHAQCVTDCDSCGLGGLSACVQLAGEGE